MEKRTEIGEVGEFGLINHIASKFTQKQDWTDLGIGDDTAVLDPKGNKVVTTTELFIEGVHFDLGYTPLQHLGFKVVSVVLSDIAAMNAIPAQITIGLGLSNRFSVESVDALYEGIQLACEEYKVDLVGGDTTSSPQGLIISMTATGVVEADKLVQRGTAKPNDVLCVTGDLGAALMGLHSLEREKQVFLANPDMKPELEGKSYVVLRQLKPMARFDMIHEFRDVGVVPTSMIDCSDGLASEIIHLCNASGLGARIFEKNIPIDDETYLAATEFNVSPLTAALNGGEDYELVFTVSQEDFPKIEKIADVTAIGYMTNIGNERVMVMKSDAIVDLTAPGFGKQ
ncbi:thiamine-phosphate kinase [Aquirufa antheringensis]|uniref:thiamine-phosphate kinase n=1 Tax=Aquirufa antheringensis TaxID=2516559 RepID=UPI001032FBFC|nr:thiamine-phosphate kinase [Aquirufa antheringensis]MCE4217750.1 thiamine-phosphate kinase [Pseudarcicella sp. GAP-15]MCZ2477580.1 thiamine-phosphate kinase [Aquirufa antheringensis]TBH71357.1 thiamine-phosphate kinase [Aquirufa antheringensis]